MYVEQISGLLLHKPNFALSLVFFLDYKDTIFVLACEQFCFSAVRYSSLSKSTTLKNYILYFLYAQYVLKETDIYHNCIYFILYHDTHGNIYYGLSVRIRGTPKMPTGVKISSCMILFKRP